MQIQHQKNASIPFVSTERHLCLRTFLHLHLPKNLHSTKYSILPIQNNGKKQQIDEINSLNAKGTSSQIADVLTKPLGATKHAEEIKMLNLVPFPPTSNTSLTLSHLFKCNSIFIMKHGYFKAQKKGKKHVENYIGHNPITLYSLLHYHVDQGISHSL